MFVLLISLSAVAPAAGHGAGQNIEAVVHAVDSFSPETLGRAIGNRRIVLLGENGHGVAEFTDAKIAIVRHLHEHLGFNIIAFESGFHECRIADLRLSLQPISASFHDCLIYQLEHAQLETLFAYARMTQETARPLRIAGIDLQLQGRATRTRPAFIREALRGVDPVLGDTVAVLDSIMIERFLAGRDSVRMWIRDHGRAFKTLVDSVASRTAGDTSWTFRTISALLRRELHRAAAAAFDLDTPTDVYAIRDEWMARTIEHLTQLDRTQNKVVVWLHNDHARYGAWRAGPLRVHTAGWWLHEWYPDDVFSVGFFMGAGTYADNSRRPQRVAEPPPASIERTLGQAGFPVAFLRLREQPRAEVRAWADARHPYVRGGTVRGMRPGREFDALVYVDRVSIARYR